MENKAIKPAHYRQSTDSMDVIDVIKLFDLNFNLGNVFKYIARAGKKDAKKHLEDLEKAREYINRELEFQHNEIEANELINK